MISNCTGNFCQFFKHEFAELKKIPKAQIAVAGATFTLAMGFMALFAYCLIRSNAEFDMGMHDLTYIDGIGIGSLVIGLPLTCVVGGILLNKLDKRAENARKKMQLNNN